MHQVDYNSTPLVQVRNLSKYFTVGHKAVLKAVEDVSFDIYKCTGYVFARNCRNGKKYYRRTNFI